MTEGSSDDGHSSLCGAKKHQGIGTCTLPAGWGTDHVGFGRCKLHGGSTWRQRKHVQVMRAEQAVRTLGLPVDIPPHDAIREELARTHGAVIWLGEIVANLDPEEVTWGVAYEEEGSGTGQREGDTQKSRREASVNIWVQLYQEERRHLVLVARTAVQVGVMEREQRLAEEQGRLIADVLSAMIGDPALGLDEEGLDRFRLTAARHLRALPA